MAMNPRLSKRFITAFICSLCLLFPQRFLGDNMLAVETFNSTAGSLQNSNGGSGWASPWQVQNGSQTTPGYNLVSTNPLAYADTVPGSYAIGGDAWQYAGRLLDTSSDGVFAPYLTNHLIGAPGTTLLVGLLMRKDADTEDEMSVTFMPASPPWWISSPGIAVGHFGSASDSGGTRYWSISLDGVVYQSQTPVVVGQAAFLVLQIGFGSTSTVDLYVNPSPGSLPTTPDTQATTSNSVAFQSVAFYGGSGARIKARSTSFESPPITARSWVARRPRRQPPAQSQPLRCNQMIALSWAPVSGASSYQVYQEVDGAPQLAATVAANNFVRADSRTDCLHLLRSCIE